MPMFNTPLPTTSARNAALLSIVGASLFIAILAVLHLVRSDLDPSWRFISEYELGPHAWLMRLAFFALALSCACLCIALVPQVRTVSGYLGFALLVLSAIGMAVAGSFAPGRIKGLHELGAILDNVPFAALLINWSLARNRAWSPTRRLLAWTAGIPLMGMVIFVASMVMMLPRHGGQPGPEVLVGWPNRIMILTQCAWLIPMAWATVRAAPGARSGPRNRPLSFSDPSADS